MKKQPESTTDPAIVVDVGNTRIKWGRCAAGRIAETVSLPAGEPAAWQTQLARWNVNRPSSWAVAGAQPRRRAALVDWLRQQGHAVTVIDSHRQLPLQILLDEPDRVGIDRLLNGVAANSRRAVGRPALLIDAGSAVTVDWLDEAGAFRGGAIFPGLRLMAQCLHEHTALLPLIDSPLAAPPLPGVSTVSAMQGGIFWAVVGGIQALSARMASGDAPAGVFLTGGDAAALGPALRSPPPSNATLNSAAFALWPEMTLEGIRLAAEALP